MSWSHRMIHGPSGAGTRSKTTASSSPFQRIQERPISMSYEEVMTETVTTCLLNPRATWQLSWERIATWGRPWRRCVQHGDVLIILPFSNWSRPRLHLGDVLITSGGVQISCFSEMLTLEGLGGLVPTLKLGSEIESTLHYANSDDAREGGAFTR